MLQCNLNRSRRAQDILGQHVLELSADWCVVSEPAFTLASWFGSKDSLAAIAPNRIRLGGFYTLFMRGTHFVAVKYGTLILVSCYVAPNV